MNPILDLFDGGEDKPPDRRDSLPPEVEEGNIEYKLKLLNPSESRFEHLVTQMKWRLQEGRGEAIYQIGVADCGTLKGLDEDELKMSLETLLKMAQRLGATMNVLRKRESPIPGPVKRYVAEVLVRKVPDDQQFLDIRVAVLGNMEVGKSTLLGVLTHSEYDNGRGKARLNLFRHLHEIQSGRTSSISHEIMGFTSEGETVNYSTCSTAEDICQASAKLITFIDLAGHQKYQKTTVFGLTAGRPDLAMLVVGANSGVAATTCEHLGFCIALKVPTFVVVSKIDLCSNGQELSIVKQLQDLLTSPGCSKLPLIIRNENDAYTAAQKFNESVSGVNLDLLRKFLNTVPKQHPHQQQLEQQLTEFQVDEIYNVPEVGTIVSGIVTSGMIREFDTVKAGPNETGRFIETQVTSIHRYRLPCRLIRTGQAATLSLKDIDRTAVRKGTVLLSPSARPSPEAQSCWQFGADIFLLHHTGAGIKKGFQATIYIASAMQTATVEEIEDKDCLQPGQKAHVHFRFLKHPEYLKVSWRVLFHDGKTRGMGEIRHLTPPAAGKGVGASKATESAATGTSPLPKR